MLNYSEIKLAVIGLGYVGLPLAVEFGKKRQVIGFDINETRINSLQKGHDSTLEISSNDILESEKLILSSKKSLLNKCNVFIVTVPTPIDNENLPDLDPLKLASQMLGDIIKKDDIVIYESTVYPGATEEICIPILEQKSGLKFNTDFFAGYSPERINPGDKVNTLTKIKKITSGSNDEVGTLVNELYGSIIDAGTHLASSIKVAEAAKVIENTQRDLNIAIVNEFAKIFNRLGIDTQQVLEAAETKWNFLPFKPGLVGGHCISVDPYYLTYKAKEMGYEPEFILAGRRINNDMAGYVVSQLVQALNLKGIEVEGSRVLVLGFTFKANCPDVRNTKIIDLINELKILNMEVDVSDHWADKSEVYRDYGIELLQEPLKNYYDAIVIGVDHNDYKKFGGNAIREYGKEKHILYDVKNILSIEASDLRL